MHWSVIVNNEPEQFLLAQRIKELNIVESQLNMKSSFAKIKIYDTNRSMISIEAKITTLVEKDMIDNANPNKWVFQTAEKKLW